MEDFLTVAKRNFSILKEGVFLKIKLYYEYATLLKLINPKYMSILTELSDGIEEIEGLKQREKYRRVLLSNAIEKTVRTSQEIEFSKNSHSDVKEPKGTFVNFSELLNFLSKNGHAYYYMGGMKPPRNVVINEKKVEIRYWMGLYRSFIKSTYKKITIPIKKTEESNRYIINTQSVHSNGKEMTSPFEINDNGRILYVEGDVNLENIILSIKSIKDNAKLPDDYLKFPADWLEYAKSYIKEKKKNA